MWVTGVCLYVQVQAGLKLTTLSPQPLEFPLSHPQPPELQTVLPDLVLHNFLSYEYIIEKLFVTLQSRKTESQTTNLTVDPGFTPLGHT